MCAHACTHTHVHAHTQCKIIFHSFIHMHEWFCYIQPLPLFSPMEPFLSTCPLVISGLFPLAWVGDYFLEQGDVLISEEFDLFSPVIINCLNRLIFLIEPRIASPWMVPPPRGWALPTLATNWENALQLDLIGASFPISGGSFLSDDFSLCQVDSNPASSRTPSSAVW